MSESVTSDDQKAIAEQLAYQTSGVEKVINKLEVVANTVQFLGKAGSGKAPMIWSGGMAWIADFPDPANFYYGILGCAGAVEGGWNWSKYCNKDLDTRAETADAMVKDDQATARIEAWKGIFDDVLKDAPWAPIFNEKRFTYHSERLGGDPALFTDPIHIPVNYDYIFAKDAQ